LSKYGRAILQAADRIGNKVGALPLLHPLIISRTNVILMERRFLTVAICLKTKEMRRSGGAATIPKQPVISKTAP